MKKFSEWIGSVREAEKKDLSPLQKSYRDYFQEKLDKYGVKSPADMDEETKKKFFNEISDEWTAGEGVKEAEIPAAKPAEETKKLPAAEDVQAGEGEVKAEEPKEEETPSVEVNKEGEIDTEK